MAHRIKNDTAPIHKGLSLNCRRRQNFEMNPAKQNLDKQGKWGMKKWLCRQFLDRSARGKAQRQE
jgi:hypothetical protein